MPLPSPLCQARHGANPFVNVAYGTPFLATQSSTLDLKLADTSGVTTWDLTCIGTDETSTPLVVTRAAPPALTATVPIPAGTGKTWVFQSRVNGGLGVNGQVDATLTTTFIVYVPTAAGLRVGAINETFEADASFGWTAIVNRLVRSGLTGFSVPVAGVATIDPAAKRIDSYRSAQSIEGGILATGSPVTILDHKLGPRNSKVIVQCWAASAASSGIQTLDAAKRITYLPSGPTWTVVASGTDVSDNTDAIGATFAFSVVTVGSDKVLRIQGTAFASFTLGATVNEVW